MLETLTLSQQSKDTFTSIFRKVLLEGKLVSPRGMLVREIEDFSFTLPPYVRFQSFECRRMNLNYTKDEFLWYLRGDRHDLSICEKAKIWKGIVNQDGSLNSNYGQYIFGKGNQFDRIVEILSKDKDSRRASVVILSREHVLSDTNDLPCTYGMNFRIRDDVLNMSVTMRSNDAIYGAGNDIPTFSFIHEMVLNALKATYPDLKLGTYHHAADSFHVYEKHFEMLNTLAQGNSSYVEVDCPRMSGPDEVEFLRGLWAYRGFEESVPERFKFCNWLLERNER